MQQAAISHAKVWPISQISAVCGIWMVCGKHGLGNETPGKQETLVFVSVPAAHNSGCLGWPVRAGSRQYNDQLPNTNVRDGNEAGQRRSKTQQVWFRVMAHLLSIIHSRASGCWRSPDLVADTPTKGAGRPPQRDASGRASDGRAAGGAVSFSCPPA